jgi:hypothetical protein
VGDLLELILDSDLKLQDLLSEVLVFDLLSHLLGFGVQAGLVKTLCMVELVRVYFREKLGQLIVHVGRLGVVLNVEVAVSKEGKGGSIPGTELDLVGKDTNHLQKY